MSSRVRKIFAILAICLLCTGCWDATEIDQLAIVVATGTDLEQSGQGNSVLATLQIALPSELGSTGGGSPTTKTGTNNAYALVEAEGADPVSALDIASKRLSRRLFMGERRVTVVGEDYAKFGLSDIADEIIRNPQSRLRTYMVVAYHNTAHAMLQLPYALNRLPADAIADLETEQYLPPVDAKVFLQKLLSKGDPFLLGLEQLTTSSTVSDSQDTVGLTHIAVFHKDKLVGWLSGPKLRGFIYIYGRINREYITVNIPGVPGFISARMLGINTSRRIHINDKIPSITIRTRCQFDIVQNGTPLDLNIPENMERVRAAIGQEMASQMQSTMDTLQHQYQSDPFGFMDTIHKKYPRAWVGMEKNWRDVYSKMPAVIQVKADIRNSGITGPSIRGTDSNTTEIGEP
ncbi:Ger(x)C family spore germination protein [Alicyclobacillus acidiphilus]|uniref:Ger(x)C family spore germination protein n=1 Tax=Alicyclobacillus acidiphilus TaxID=182455 RepID=UPI000836F929|nr:Ger(x)C family spore germination protein [Alicyclobacillus acidiphilus]